MANWVRFQRGGAVGFGTLDGETIKVHTGDMFASPTSTGETLPLASVTLLPPTAPSKMVALWNNSRSLGAKLNTPPPDVPLHFLKSPGSLLAHGAAIKRPASYAGKIIFEAELAIVIGKRITNATEAQAAAAIFGYTCINDVTAIDILFSNPTFPQWARAKSFDTFGALGPAIVTGVDVSGSNIKAVLNGQERQNYPVSDLYYQPVDLVARVSHDMTLEPGDIIACGTSIGVGVMKEPTNVIEIVIDGIGTLRNTFDQ